MSDLYCCMPCADGSHEHCVEWACSCPACYPPMTAADIRWLCVGLAVFVVGAVATVGLIWASTRIAGQWRADHGYEHAREMERGR